MAHLSLSFLGGFEVTLDAKPVTALGSDKGRALLAYLAIEATGPHRRAELSAMFWPDMPEKKAAHNLSQALLRLRQELQEKEDPGRPAFLVVTPQDIQFNLNSHCQLDVARFRELVDQCDRHQHPQPTAACPVCIQWLSQALDLYRGDLLAGLFIADSYTFEEWRLAQQEELHRQALEALARLAVYYEQRGEWDRVQENTRRQIALEPWREEAHAQLMRALAKTGQTGAALRQYESLTRTLQEELGVKPSPEVIAQYEQIRAYETSQPAQTAVQPASDEAAWLPAQGERRPVTVLVCGRGTGQEGEDIQEQLAHCERHCEAIFHRFGGQRAQRLGDACMITFGYPTAYEDAARRAVHSALEVAAAVRSTGKALHGEETTRIGIHSGIITVGEKRGRRWQDRDLLGTALELARDCQRRAGAGQVLISADTRRLVQAFFDLQAAEPTLIAADGQPLAVYRVRGESGIQNRLDWLAQAQRLTQFTGREAELAQVRACHDQLRQGKGQVVVMRGEPGIGKSRLLWEVEKRTPLPGSLGEDAAGPQDQPHPTVRWLTSRCLPYYQNTSLYPVVGLLEQLLEFQSGDSAGTRQEKLTNTLAHYRLDHPSAAWLLALLLGLPDQAAVAEPAAQQSEPVTRAQREQMREVFVALVQKCAAEGPLVLVIEDLHWSDPSTVEWLGQSLAALSAVPCLVLLTTRPEFRPAWLEQVEKESRVLLLALQPLPPEQAELILTDLAGECALGADLRRRIITQTDGNPLFIEELTKELLEQPRPGADSGPNIPTTLLNSLMARLDRLGPAKETAQWAAALGREFTYPVLQACAPYDEQRLQNDLARLIEAELVFPIQAASQDAAPFLTALSSTDSTWRTAPTRYTFKHALAQEAAYASLLKRTRQVYHRRIAETLENRFPQAAEMRPEILAQHYAGAGMQPRAADFWLRAGERATAQGAVLEARIFFDRAMAASEPGDIERRWQALAGRERVFDLLVENEAQQQDVAALLELAERCHDDTRRAQAWLRQVRYLFRRNEYGLALSAAQTAQDAAARAGNRVLEVHALAARVVGYTSSGERALARQTAEETLAKLPAISDEAVEGYALGNVALYYHNVGDLSRAVLLMEQSAQKTQAAGDLSRAVRTDVNIGFTYIQLGLYTQARTALEKGLALAKTIGERGLPTSYLGNLSYAAWCLGDREEALRLGERSLQENIAIGYSRYGQAACHAYLGFYLADGGQWALATAHLSEARLGFAQLGLEFAGLEAKAVEARCRLALGQAEEARQMAGEVWAYLCEHGSAGIDFPARVYLGLADVFAAVPTPASSEPEVLETGCRDLMQRAEQISDAQWRRSFLENVRENRELLERYQEIHLVDLGGVK